MVTKNIGDSVTLTVNPRGAPTGTLYTVKFYKSGISTPVFIPTIGTYVFTKTNLQLSDAGTYYATSEYICNIDQTIRGPISSSTDTLIINQPTTKYRCTGAPDYQCAADPNGQYNSLEECQAVCKAPLPGTITVTNPPTGVIYRHGESRIIKWTSTNAGQTVKIVLLKANNVVVKTISYRTSNDGQMTWRVPYVASRTDYRIKIISTKNVRIFGISGKFTIK